MIRNESVTPYVWSKISGATIVFIAILAIIVELGIRTTLIIPGDATKTASNLLANEGLFRLSIFMYLILLLGDVIIAIGFYVVLKPVDKNVALLSAFLRLIYVAIRGVSQILLMVGFLILKNANQETMAQGFFEADVYAFSISLALFFSSHLFLLGYLAVKSGYVPKLLGYLLYLASFAYLLDNSLRIILVNYEEYKIIITAIIFLPALVGELAFGLWLLLKAKRDTIPYRASST